MSYATVAQLKEYVGVTTAGDDALLTRLLASAQGIIDTHTGRTFEAATDSVKTFDATPDMSLWLSGHDLCQITSIVNGDGTTIATEQYATEPRGITPYFAIRLKASAGIRWTYVDDPEDAITITGRWAYSLTAPADITHAAIRVAAWLYRQKDSSADLDRHIVSPDGIALAPARLPNDIVSQLQAYRRRV